MFPQEDTSDTKNQQILVHNCIGDIDKLRDKMWQDHTISQANKTEKEEATGQSFKKIG